MVGISKSTVIFFSIILIISMLTVISDLKSKKIYNEHLIIGAVLGLTTTIYTAVWLQENVLFHIINGLIAFIAGTFFHRIGIWRGGDAKLFTLYAFLMPALERNHILLSSVVNLFACSFIAGAIILIPIFIKDIASNYNAIIIRLLSPKKNKFMFTYIQLTIFYSWILFPIYYFAGFIHFPAMSLVITYLIFYIVRHFLKKAPVTRRTEYIGLGCGIALGFLMRLWLSPNSLSWPILPYSILKIWLFSALSACIYAMLDLFNKEYHSRVPFAPLLFIGCVLSYTPFLTWIIHLVR